MEKNSGVKPARARAWYGQLPGKRDAGVRRTLGVKGCPLGWEEAATCNG